MEEQGLVVVKDNFLFKVTNTLKRFFFKGKMKDLLLDEAKDEQNNTKVQLIKADTGFVQLEILEARRAYRKYVINNSKNISKNVFSYISNRLKDNERKIRQLIEINNDDIVYEDILDILENEANSINQFKSKSETTGYYSVPVGVIGIECADTKDSIKSIFKAISTRNAIIVLHDNYSEYSTESLILLIVKECLKNFYIDDNIIQMYGKEEIDLEKLNKFIQRDGGVIDKKTSNAIYIYQEDDKYAENVKNEIIRLENTEMYKDYEIKPIKGEFGNIVNYLNNKSDSSAVCMYTENAQKAYKFINWVDSPNVFVNTGIKNCLEAKSRNSEFYNSKYVLHEGVF